MKKKGFAAVCLILCFWVSAGQIGQKNVTLTEAIAGEVKRTAYLGVVKSYIPGFYYETAERNKEQTALEFVVDKTLELLPVYGYMQTRRDYETPAESELSYEAILKREALDENYVDEETGEVILAALYENEEEILSEAETENARARKEAGQEEDGETAETHETEAAQETETVQEVGEEPGETAKQEADTFSVADNRIGNFQVQTEPIVNYPREKLNDYDYLIQNFYTVDRSTTINSSQLVAEQLLAADMSLKTTPDQPQILIYHTHSQEMYIDSTPGDVMTGVVGCGEYLKEILSEKYGYNVIHHMGQYDVENRDYAYSNAAPALEQLLAENPSIEVVIDLHRDAVPEDVHMVRNVQGIDMAPIMFFNGLSRLAGKGDIAYLNNPYIMDNLAISFQMKLAACEYYPDLTRPVYLKGYRYNMHYCPKTLLVELGAQTNTFEEAKNAMAPLADLLHKVLGG